MRLFYISIHHHTISPLADHTREETSDTQFVAGLKIQTIDWNCKKKRKKVQLQLPILGWQSSAVLFCFHSLVLMKGLFNTIDNRLSSTSAAEDLLGFFFSALQRLYFFLQKSAHVSFFNPSGKYVTLIWSFLSSVAITPSDEWSVWNCLNAQNV